MNLLHRFKEMRLMIEMEHFDSVSFHLIELFLLIDDPFKLSFNS